MFFFNISTNQMQKFLKFITWCLLVCTAQHGFGRLHAHRQELNNSSSSLWVYRWSVVVVVLLVVVGPVGWLVDLFETYDDARTCKL